MAQDPYVYPGTNVLRNRFDIRDAEELRRREAETSTIAIAQLRIVEIPGRYDPAHLQAFHKHIFGDLYDWAGEIRTVTIAKGDTFALPQHIENYLGDVLRHLPDENYLRGLKTDPAVDRLTHYLAEINAAHPFREGNGRTQRAFITQLATNAGYHVDWHNLDQSENIAASQAAIRGNNRPLRELLAARTQPLDAIRAADIAKRSRLGGAPRHGSTRAQPYNVEQAQQRGSQPGRTPKR